MEESYRVIAGKEYFDKNVQSLIFERKAHIADYCEDCWKGKKKLRRYD